MSVDFAAVERYLALLESADERIDHESAALLRSTSEQLAHYAQSIAHRQSGLMADSIHPLGPFALAGGILESQISSAASYTDIELQRGGGHDWANRTLSEQAALLTQLQERTERLIAAAIGGD